jgi:hypothetical protein
MSTQIPGSRPRSNLQFKTKLPDQEFRMEIPATRKPTFTPGNPSSLVNPFMRDNRLQVDGRYAGKNMLGGGPPGERDTPFTPDENVRPGHMIGGFEVIKQDWPVSIQTLDSRHESTLAAIEDEKRRRKEVKEKRRINALGHGEIQWDSES